jgi:hypothetical protein
MEDMSAYISSNTTTMMKELAGIKGFLTYHTEVARPGILIKAEA